MKQRVLVPLAWGLCALSLLLLVYTVVISSRGVSGLGEWLGGASDEFAFTAFAAVGALITTRQPGNRIGWIFSAIGVGTAFTSFSDALSLTLTAALDHAYHGTLTPLVTPQVVTVTDLLGNVVWSGNMLAFLLLLLIFPTGRLLSPRWRVVVWAALASAVLQGLVGMLDPQAIAGGRLPNPLASLLPTSLRPLMSPDSPLGLLFLPLILGVVVSLIAAVVLRFRRARGVERQQLKWFTYGAVATLVLIVVASALTSTGSLEFGLAFLVLPVTVAISILRYRLFDIDVIINQTLVYGSLTALLAAVYIGSVIVLQAVTRTLTGARADSAPVIVVSTLLIAALFQPLRTRLQRTIDRRFYRSKYDAAKTLARFAETLRSEVELSDLQAHLVGVVEETMRPAHVSLWLREDVVRKGGRQ